MNALGTRRRAKGVVCWLLAASFALPSSVRGTDVLARIRARWHNHQGVPTAEALAVEIESLENHLNCYGTVVAKQPDVWGQARMMKHRQEFEKQLAGRLDAFKATLQASVSRTDQAFLTSAFSLSAAISGAPAVAMPQSATVSREIVERRRAALSAQGVANPTPEQLGAGTEPTTIPIPTSNPAAGLTDDFDTPGVLQRRDFTKTETGVGKFETDAISLEPTEYLDQMARYLNHLNELRRINEGDDTADSPGYALHLVRIPVSILPGTITRKGHGAEITITASPYLGRDLLPTTFRNLVINDVSSQAATAMTEFFNSPSSLAGFEKLRKNYQDAAEEARVRTAATVPGRPAGLARMLPPGRRDAALRRTAQDVTTLDPIPASAPAAESQFQRDFNRSLVGKYMNTPIGRQAGLSASAGRIETRAFPEEMVQPPMPASSDEKIAVEARKLDQAFSTTFKGFAGRTIPSTRARNAPFAFPGTQLGEVYGWDVIRPVAFQAYDVVIRKRLEDDPGAPLVVPYQRVAGYTRDEVEAAYSLLARPESAPLWASFATPSLAAAVRSRDAAFIKATREAFLSALPNQGLDDDQTYGPQVTSTAAFAWAILVESVLLNERLIRDVAETAAAKGAPAPPADGLPFFLPDPPDEARDAFNDYVRIRFPIHVFALDPVNQEQNLADQLARSRETQLALSLAFVTGNISAGSMTRFARRMELQAETIALNRTQVAFSHGDDVFGWRFQPRYQTPPTQNNLAAFAQTLGGGPTRDGDRRQLEIEPGMRECVAIVIMPSFVPYATFDAKTNWYRLNSPKHTEIDTLKFLELSRSIQRARTLAQSVCDAGLYRDGDIARLVNRVGQLAARLPMQTMIAQVPYENTHGGFELFNVGVTDLGPELRSWYGAPGVSPDDATSLFLVGDNFSVHQTNVVVGNRLLDGDGVQLLSRQVMRITVPGGAQTVTRGGRPFVEASIATPYGVSQSLYIPVHSNAPNPAPVAPPASDYSIDTRTQTLKLTHTLKDAFGKPRVGDAAVDPSTPRIDVLWNNSTGIAPKQVQVEFTFPYKGTQLSIPLSRPIQLTGVNQGYYRITGADLERIAQEYVDQLDGLGNFTIDAPLPTLTSNSVTITPVPADGAHDVQPLPAAGALQIIPRPVGLPTRGRAGDPVPAAPPLPQ